MTDHLEPERKNGTETRFVPTFTPVLGPMCEFCDGGRASWAASSPPGHEFMDGFKKFICDRHRRRLYIQDRMTTVFLAIFPWSCTIGTGI